MCLPYTTGFVPSVFFIEISMHDSNVSLYCCYIEELEVGENRHLYSTEVLSQKSQQQSKAGLQSTLKAFLIAA